MVSYDPVYVRLLDSPPKNCIEIYSQFVSTLPSSESVYLDITHYHGYDTQCIVDEFKKKYEIIYWVYDPSSDDDIKFKKLWGW